MARTTEQVLLVRVRYGTAMWVTHGLSRDKTEVVRCMKGVVRNLTFYIVEV